MRAWAILLLVFSTAGWAADNRCDKNRPLILQAWKNQVYLNGQVHTWNDQNDAIRVFQEWISLMTLAQEKNEDERRKVGLALEKYVVAGNIKPLGKMGTTVPGYAQGDFDMTLLGSTSLLELFMPDRLLLTDKTAVHLIKHLSTLWGQAPKDNFDVLFVTLPETENHFFMTESSRYLINQMITENDRKLKGLKVLNDSLEAAGVSLDNEKGNLKPLLLKAMQQAMRNGFFEFNAQIYQRFTIHALDNLYSFANDSTIKNGSACLLDYLSTVFAFQSYGGIRYGPYRRSAEVYRDSSLIGRDAACSFFLAQSGQLNFDAESKNEIWKKQMGHADMALFSVVLKYRIPNPILTYMESRPQEFRAEIRSAYAGLGERKHPTEIYSGGSHYLVTAGGRYEKYLGTNFPLLLNFTSLQTWFHKAPWIYDVITRSSSVLLNPDIESPHSCADILHFQGEQWKANNMAVYKGFVYGSAKMEEGKKLTWPQNIPSKWCGDNLANPSGKIIEPSEIDLAHSITLDDSVYATRDFEFRFLDRSSAGVYIVLSRLKSPHHFFFWTSSQYSRGTIEVVDTADAHSLQALRVHTLSQNPAKGLWSLALNRFVYVTFDGTELFLNSSYDGKRDGILRVDASRAKPNQNLSEFVLPFHFPNSLSSISEKYLSLAGIFLDAKNAEPPLLEVNLERPWKGKAAVSDGHGNLYVYHPGSGEYVLDNFREWWNPVRKLSLSSELPNAH